MKDGLECECHERDQDRFLRQFQWILQYNQQTSQTPNIKQVQEISHTMRNSHSPS